MTDALQDAKYKIERAETTADLGYATFMTSSATAHALIAIAERLDILLHFLDLENERKELQ